MIRLPLFILSKNSVKGTDKLDIFRTLRIYDLPLHNLED